MNMTALNENLHELCQSAGVAYSSSVAEVHETVHSMYRNWQQRVNLPDLSQRQEAERRIKALGILLVFLKENSALLDASTEVEIEPSVLQRKEGEDRRKLAQQAWGLFDKKQFSEALHVAQEWTESSKCDPIPWVLRAKIFEAQRRHDDAVLEMRMAVKLQPRNASYRHSMAELLEKTGAIREALNEAVEALSLDPERIIFNDLVKRLRTKSTARTTQ